ncbi:MAG: hypothetical protein K2J76_06190 [Oscillospiraceae bacterium]|nr:hypothetical protein [Oscillospiraceae bacterium]
MFEEARVKSCNAITDALNFKQNNGQITKAEKQKVRKQFCYAICGPYSMFVWKIDFWENDKEKSFRISTEAFLPARASPLVRVMGLEFPKDVLEIYCKLPQITVYNHLATSYEKQIVLV